MPEKTSTARPGRKPSAGNAGSEGGATLADLTAVRSELARLADPERAIFLQRFFKTGPGEYAEGDRFLGIRVPQLRALAREARGLSTEAALELLRSPWHEERLFALILLVQQHRKAPATERERIHREYLAHTGWINNWDLVDASAEHLVGGHLDPDDAGTVRLLDQLAASDSLWERRIAMLATFHWIRRRRFDLALRVADRLVHDEHDLIHKAVGWMLREIGKRDRREEEAFLARHCGTMPRTMLRYAIEHFPPELRAAYMRGEVRSGAEGATRTPSSRWSSAR